ncbi:T9SS type A sorting domain-containing protein [Phaeodactylibacter xiamenensis]|uniref:T9SS type A sorting domain-containing protein n=1 Tax=Phaeodactylibacter xiamenensis TaxID=1524460 RepID=UPI003CCBCD1C
MKRTITYILPLIFSLFTSGHLLAQSVALQLDASKDCNLYRYCTDIILASDSGEPVRMGTSSLLLTYNAEALTFHSYEPLAYNGGQDCLDGTMSPWSAHEYDAYSHPGEFSLTLLLNDAMPPCAEMDEAPAVTIGTVCFDVKQQGSAPEISFDAAHTSLNSRQVNNGTAALPVSSWPTLSEAGSLACDCPGAGAACDDQNVYTVNDQYDNNCNCKGVALDSDGDGIPDGVDPCRNLAYEAENFLEGNTTVHNHIPHFYGDGFIDYTNDTSEFILLQVETSIDGEHQFTFRYTSDHRDRFLQLAIDGEVVVPALLFPETTDWEDWQEITLPQILSAGTHEVTLRPVDGWGPNLDRMVVSICDGCTDSGSPCDDGDPCTIDDVLDRDCNCGGRVIDEDGDQIPDLCDPHVGTAADFPLETGIAPSVTENWQTITLAETYDSMVVIATPHLMHKTDLPVVTRIRNAQGNSFELRIQNPGGTTSANYAVYYAVAEAGTYSTEHDGIKMEARLEPATKTADASNWWGNREQRTFRQYYENPVVLGQVMTSENDAWSVFWASRGNHSAHPPEMNNLSAGKHKGEDYHTTRTDEMIGFLIIEAGSYQVRNRILEAGLGSDIVRGPNNNGYTYDLDNPEIRGAVLSAAGMDGGNGYWPVLFGEQPIEPGLIRMVADEDQIHDTERGHTTEQVAYLAFEDRICRYDADMDGICDAEDVCPGFDDMADEDEDGLPDACDDCNDNLIGRPCDDGIACTILDVYTEDCGCAGIPMDSDGDGVCNWDDICENGDDNTDTDNDGIPDACDPNVGDATTMPIETGLITGVSDTWQTVTLNRSFEDMVVIATVQLPSYDYAPVVPRVRNASGNTFELKVQNPGGSTDSLYDVHFVAVQAGKYQAAHDGVTMEAGFVSALETANTGSWWSAREKREIEQSYTQPVLLGQVMSENDTRWSVFWASMGNHSGNPAAPDNYAMGKHVAADTITDRAVETIGYILMEAGQYNLSGVMLEAGVGPAIIGGQNASDTYNTVVPAPNGAVLSVAGVKGGDGHWPVLYGAEPFGNQSFELSVDEDQISDSERWHMDESIAFIAFNNTNATIPNLALTTPDTPEPASQIAAVSPTQEAPITPGARLQAFPNPVYDAVTVNANVKSGTPCTLTVVDMNGKVRLTRIHPQTNSAVLQETLNLSHLPNGYYFLRLTDVGRDRTIRLVKVNGQ